jgi:hypothetical protein
MLIVDASGLTISKRKVIILRRRNGYVGKRVYQAAYSCRRRIYKKVVSFRE